MRVATREVAKNSNHGIPDTSAGVAELKMCNECASSLILPALFSDSHLVVLIFLTFHFFLSSVVPAPVVFFWLFQVIHAFRAPGSTGGCLWDVVQGCCETIFKLLSWCNLTPRECSSSVGVVSMVGSRESNARLSYNKTSFAESYN